MAPLVRRTWASPGQTPRLVPHDAGTRQKVSVSAALGLSPRRDRLGLYSQTLVNGSFGTWHSAAFLAALRHDRAGRFGVIGDGGRRHKGDPIDQRAGPFVDRLTLERLPPSASMLNPVEWLWSWLKSSRLNNFAPRDAAQLNQRILGELSSVRDDQRFLRNLFHASDPPLPRALQESIASQVANVSLARGLQRCLA
jgi:transposase